MKSILITGCSSGYGLATAQYFLQRGWRVVATMRNPQANTLALSDRLTVLPLDVTRVESIAAALEAAGPLDALVNNAGIGAMGALESTPLSKIREVFETNTLGTIAMTQAVIPQFRGQRSGTIVNVTSSVTLTPMPLTSAYSASKMAIEGFTAALAFELAAFGIGAKLVEPGYGPTTRFAQNTDLSLEDTIPQAYRDFAQPILEGFAEPALTTDPSDVAMAIWQAVTDGTGQLRYPAGPDAIALAKAA